MKEEKLNSTGKAVYIAQDHAKLDEIVKHLLAQKPILAYILKYTVQELEDYSMAEIIPMIEDVSVGAVQVEPGATNDMLTGMPQESKILGEGEVSYDVRFFLRLPGHEEIAEYNLIIDVEAQGKPGQSYWVETRGIVYDARMISEQVGRNITHGHYENTQKVYSIWICMNSPQEYANTISEYGITERKRIGTININPRIDLMSVVVIRLPKDDEWHKAKNPANRLTEMLSTLMSNAIVPEKKLDALAHEYDIAVTEEIETEVSSMCNYSYAIAEQAAEKATKKANEKAAKQLAEARNQATKQVIEVKNLERKQNDLTSIQNLMQTTGWSVTEAMDKLKIDPDKRSDYADIIAGTKPAMA